MSEYIDAIMFVLFAVLFGIFGFFIGTSAGKDLVLEKHTELCYEQEYKGYDSCKEFLVNKALEKGK